MCGICGIIGISDEQTVSKMLQAIRHRGPDAEGIFNDENLTLGMVRLSIIDLSANGNQPMSNESQTVWIVFNGEMYNYKEEKEILEKNGLKFKSTSDTEVVLKMYEEYGISFLNRIRGMFALAIFDKRKAIRKTILARDQFGIKPLIYSYQNGILTFASEMKAILQCSHINKELDYEAIKSLIIFGSLTQPDTMIRNVKMLLPAHYLILENNQLKIARYARFEIDKYPEIKKIPYSEQVSMLKEILSDSVKAHMISDVPIGAFLSGGLDSSLLVANMAMHSKKLVTFCVGYGDEGKLLDESDAAQRIADYIGTEHHRLEITSTDFKNNLMNIIRALDQPSIDGVNSYFVSMAAKKYAKVAISGTGGDEFFIGYPWFNNSYYKFNNRKLDKQIETKVLHHIFNSPLMKKVKNTAFDKYIEYAANFNDPDFYLASYISLFQQNGAKRIFTSEISQLINQDKSMAAYMNDINETANCGILSKLSVLSFRTYTQNQLLRDIDATSSAHSIEIRVPFIDQKIAEFALSLPESSLLNPIPDFSFKKKYTYQQSGIKKMLVDIGKDILPENLNAQTKKGFQMPFGNWIKSDLNEIVEEITSSTSINKRGLFNFSEIQKIKKDFYSGKESWGKLWMIVVIELWCREFLD